MEISDLKPGVYRQAASRPAITFRIRKFKLVVSAVAAKGPTFY